MLNIFLEPVYEDEQGKRYLKKQNKIIYEDDLSGLQFARCKNKKDSDILFSNLFNPVFLSAFENKLDRIFTTYYGKSIESDLYKKFVERVRLEMLLLIQRVWKKGLKYDLSFAKSWMGLHNQSGFPFWLQYGLFNRFIRQQKEKIVELGLKHPADSSLLSYPKALRTIFTDKFENTVDFQPYSYLESSIARWGVTGQLSNNEPLKQALDDPSSIKLIWNLPNEVVNRLVELGHKVIFVTQAIHSGACWRFTDSPWRIYFLNFSQGTKENVLNATSWTDLASLSQAELDLEEEVNEGQREPYVGLSQGSSANAMISSRLAPAVYHALNQLDVDNVDRYLANKLKLSLDELYARLSSAQIDAAVLGIRALEKQKGMILADETGFGKGRILASIALAGLLNGKTVIFFTENSQLFSDFYRDLTDVMPNLTIRPTLLNQDGKVYDAEGNIVVKSHSKRSFQEMLDRNWHEGEDRLILTNYSQINQKVKGKKGLPKVEFLKNRIKDQQAWIILDEAHNASGDSNTYDNLKKIIPLAEGVIYSSATYAKNEEKLTLYEKAMPFNPVAKALLKLSLAGTGGELRELLTYEVAKAGNFIRREHPPIALPDYDFIEVTEKKRQIIQEFSNIWREIFNIAEQKEQILGFHSAKAWLALGGTLSRSIREFNFLMKIDALADHVEQSILENRKVVITTDLTFESSLTMLLEQGKLNADSDEDEQATSKNTTSRYESEDRPHWGMKLATILDGLFDEDKLKKEMKEAFFNAKNEGKSFDANVVKEQIVYLAESTHNLKQRILSFDHFSLSPLDELRQKMEEKPALLGKVGELSGRNCRLYVENGLWVIDGKLKKIERSELVRKFNGGELDVMILTAAGSTGISLHSGKNFKDQRQRELIELDISNDTARRIQFLGRVYRNNQVNVPVFKTKLNNHLSDIRRVEVEKRKQIILMSHVGGRKENKVLDWISEEGDLIVREWAKERPIWSRRIGVYSDRNTKRTDRLLQRALILPDAEQETLFRRLEEGIQLHQDYYFFLQELQLVSESTYQKPFWGDSTLLAETKEDESLFNEGTITLGMRRWWFNEKPCSTEVAQGDKFNELIALFEEIYRQEPVTVQKQSVIHVLKKHFATFKLGQVIQLSLLHFVKKAKVLDVVYVPSMTSPTPSHEISGVFLNGVGFKVYIQNTHRTVVIPLYRLLNDPYFKTFPTQSLPVEKLPILTLTLEGNPLLLSVWAKKTGLGHIRTVRDKHEIHKTVLVLPRKYTLTHYEQMRKPFMSIAQIPRFIRHTLAKTPEGVMLSQAVTNTFFDVDPITQKEVPVTLAFFARDKEWTVHFPDFDYYKKCTWLPKAYGFIEQKREQEGKFAELVIRGYKVYEFLSFLESEGIYFFVPEAYNMWFDEDVKTLIKSK